MLKWTLQTQTFSKITRTCFCQGTSVYAQHAVVVSRHSWPSVTRGLYSGRWVASKHEDLPKPKMSTSGEPKTESAVSETKHVAPETISAETEKLTNKAKLKRAVKDYGATVIVFHVAISLTSLGISYLAISSGVDVASLLSKVGMSSTSELATGASTFVVAYAAHKVFAPVRISITLAATPFIVRYLRRVGVLKPPKTTSP